MMALDVAEFRQALGSFVTGVTIVTTRTSEGVDVGLTANSFNSVSLDPPMVLWSLAKTAASLPVFLEAQHFAVHILAIDQEPLSNKFARRGEDKFLGLTLERGRGDVPLLPGCSARFECRTAHRYEGGDHIIFVGEVTSFENCAKRPLAFHAGRYAAAATRSWPSLQMKGDEAEGTFNEDFLGYLIGRAHYQFYSRVRPHLARYNLSDLDHYILGLLGMGDGCTIDHLDSVVSYTGHRVSSGLLQSLSDRRLVSLDGAVGATQKMWLTDEGRQIMVQLTAEAKSVEAGVERSLSEEEARSLKQLLKKIIHETDSGLPGGNIQ